MHLPTSLNKQGAPESSVVPWVSPEGRGSRREGTSPPQRLLCRAAPGGEVKAKLCWTPLRGVGVGRGERGDQSGARSWGLSSQGVPGTSPSSTPTYTREKQPGVCSALR